MPDYIVVNSHPAEDCDPMDAGLTHLPARLEGRDFICTCPYGEHGFYLLVEAGTAEEAILGLPAEWRPGSRAHQVEIFRLGKR